MSPTAIVLIFLVLLVLGIALGTEGKQEQDKRYYTPTVPDRKTPMTEKELVARLKHIKDLVNRGKYDKAIALLKRMEIPEDAKDDKDVGS